MLTIFSTIGALALGLLVSGPALKARFELGDALAYILPTLIFGFATVVLNVLNPLGMPKRVGLSLLMLLPLLASSVGFVVGYADESRTLILIAINCALGMLVVAFPWNPKNFNVLVGTLAAVGIILSLNAMTTFSSSLDEYDAVSALNDSRLSVAFAIGLAAIANLYFVVRAFSPVALGALGLCWLGLALSLSRGPVLFCAFASVIYLAIVFRSGTVRFGLGKKILVVVAVSAMVPMFIDELMSVEKNQRRFTRVFDIGAELADGGRGEIWKESLLHISESPLYGHGLGAATAEGGTPHNLFLQYGEDSGLIGIVIMLVLFGIVGLRILKALRLSNANSINMVLVSGAMFVYMLLNFQKSSDAYVNRESFVLSALPLAIYGYLSIGHNVKGIIKKSRRRRRRVATAVAINEVRKKEQGGSKLLREESARR